MHKRNIRGTLVSEHELHRAIDTCGALALGFTKRPNPILLGVNIVPRPATGWTGSGWRGPPRDLRIREGLLSASLPERGSE